MIEIYVSETCLSLGEESHRKEASTFTGYLIIFQMKLAEGCILFQALVEVFAWFIFQLIESELEYIYTSILF